MENTYTITNTSASSIVAQAEELASLGFRVITNNIKRLTQSTYSATLTLKPVNTSQFLKWSKSI